MTIAKLQKFLKNKHKFDKKSDMYEIVEQFDAVYGGFKQAVKDDADPAIRSTLSSFLVTLLKYANTKDISLDELADEHYSS